MGKGILIKYGEIAIKGNNRAQFENLLLRNVRNALYHLGNPWIDKEQGRLFVRQPAEAGEDWMEQAVSALQNVFGIVGIAPVDVLEDDSFEAIARAAVEYVQRKYGGAESHHSFKVESKRADKRYPMNSMEISREVGSRILDACPNYTVDVHHPDFILWVEVRNQVYVYSKTLPGPGGMPSGCAGKGALLLSGGIDSPVAGWMMAKRGLELCAVYFHAHPYTSERAKEKVVELARRVSRYAGKIRLYVVPFTQIQLDIYEKCPHDQLTIIMRRAMMRIAERIAEKEGAQALITGESLGQVASQTLQSLYCTNQVCKMPVFRPVIGFDKQDIVEIAQKIDTFETSILPYEDCCTIFVAKHPVTKPRAEAIQESEKHLPDLEEQIQKAVEDSEIITVDYFKRSKGESDE